jgi:RNA polymerase sigma-70 factor (ECF subfamily)
MSSDLTRPLTLDSLLAEATWARRLAERLLHDRAEAEDVAQDALVMSLQARPDDRLPARAWLGRVVRNLSFNRRRDAGRLAARHLAAAEVSAAVPSPEELLERMQALRWLAEHVTALDEPYRQTLLLHFFEGLSSADISRATGTPEGTVRWRMKVALDRLRAALADEEEGGLKLLIALAPNRSPRARGAVVVATAVVVAALIMVLAPVAARAPRRNHTGSGSARSAVGGPSSLAASVSPNDSCTPALTRLRSEIARIEKDYLRLASPGVLFRDGTANTDAERAVAAPLAQVMHGDAAAAPSYTLECRTWACRMLVLDSEAAPSGWMEPLQLEPQTRDVFPVQQFWAARPVRDPVSGASLQEVAVYLRLADHLAGPAVPTQVAGSGDRVDCERERREIERRLASMRAVVNADKPLDVQFEAAVTNRELTEKVTAEARRLSGARPSDVSCRGQICRIAPVDPDAGAYELPELLDGSDFWRSVRHATLGSVAYVEVRRNLKVANGMDYLRGLVVELDERLEKGPSLEPACPAALVRAQPTSTPSRGESLLIRLTVAETAEPRASDLPGEPFTVDYGGALADDGTVRCVAAQIQRLQRELPKPEVITGAMLFHHLTRR